jgi:hypothetical protein
MLNTGPLPDFNERGLLPPGFHTTSIAEFKRKLGFNARRLHMIERGLEPVLRELKVRKVTQLFVNGSFVTANPDPKDIDAYVLVPGRESSLFWWVGHRSRKWGEIYGVECFPAVQGVTGPGSEAYWQELFGHQDGTPKGIVVLNL